MDSSGQLMEEPLRRIVALRLRAGRQVLIRRNLPPVRQVEGDFGPQLGHYLQRFVDPPYFCPGKLRDEQKHQTAGRLEGSSSSSGLANHQDLALKNRHRRLDTAEWQCHAYPTGERVESVRRRCIAQGSLLVPISLCPIPSGEESRFIRGLQNRSPGSIAQTCLPEGEDISVVIARDHSLPRASNCRSRSPVDPTSVMMTQSGSDLWLDCGMSRMASDSFITAALLVGVPPGGHLLHTSFGSRSAAKRSV